MSNDVVHQSISRTVVENLAHQGSSLAPVVVFRSQCVGGADHVAVGLPVHLRCTRRVGGWPQAALIASVDGKAYFADGILPLLPVLERSVGVLSGHLAPASAASVRAAKRLPPPTRATRTGIV